MAELSIFIIKPTIEAINDILHMENCNVGGIEGVPVSNKLNVNPEHIDLEFDSTITAVPSASRMENLPVLELKTDKAIYRTPSYGASFEGTIIMDGHLVQHFDVRFYKLTQSTIEEGCKYYWRFIYPIDSNEWFLKVKGRNFADDFGSHHFSNLIVADLDGHEVNVYSSNIDNHHWMIIESTEAITYEEMDRRVLSVTNALGLVLGRRYGDYCFHVASNVSDFSLIIGVEVLSLRKTKYCPYKILNPQKNLIVEWLRQYDYQQYALDSIESNPGEGVKWYYEDESIVTIDAFSKLAQLCFKSNDILLATSMLIDGSLMNIVYQKPFFHVTLETITTTLLKNEEDLPPTVPQDRYNQEIVPVLLKTLDGIEWLGEDEKRIFTKRITNNLNTAPNSNKLEACFPKFGYVLTKADKKAINMRNSTFHGTLSSEKKPLKAQQNEMFAVGLRLHKLCSILLLKAAGFSGKVLNNEVLFGIYSACESKEPVYVEI